MTDSDGCGSVRWNATSNGPLTATSLMLNHHVLRGFLRILLSTLPVRASHVHFTSAEVNGLPSCHFTPSRSWNVNVRSSSLYFHDVARSGTIASSRFCLLSGSNTTKLLNTGVNGVSTVVV